MLISYRDFLLLVHQKACLLNYFFHPTEKHICDKNLESDQKFLHCSDHALFTYNGIFFSTGLFFVLFWMLFRNVKVKMFVWIMLNNCCFYSFGFYFLWQASYIIFLGFFSYALLTGFKDEVTWIEILLYVWVSCLHLDEVREVR